MNQALLIVLSKT